MQATVFGRFERVATEMPDHIAVREATRTWTYAQLLARANAIAAHLDDKGAGDRVACLLSHGGEMIAAIFGVLAGGRAYVPIDPTHPADRTAFVLADSGATTLLHDAAQAEVAARLAGGVPRVCIDDAPPGRVPARRPGPDTLAYCLYTSGSTGRPKGVPQVHANVLHFIDAYRGCLEIGPTDAVSLLSTFAFDAAVVDVFAALLSGATLCPYDLRGAGFAGLSTMLADRGVTIYHSTPTVFRELAQMETRLSPQIRAVVLGGEEVRAADVTKFRAVSAPNAVLVNGYGMTECSWALINVIRSGDPNDRETVPLGTPIDGVRVTLVPADDEPELAAEGFGTIVIECAHVAGRYWQRPEETAAAFPSPGVYVTTDYGRLIPDGRIEFAGRKASHVKLRGYRIDLREIESVVLTHPNVREAAVVLRETARGDELVAYVSGERAPDLAALRTHLSATLPVYMLPTAVVQMSALPRGATNKLDRRALPLPEESPSTAGYVAPRNPIEETIARIWQEILGVERVGANDDFFALGGHSLKILRVIAGIRKDLGVELAFRVMFEKPTLAELARAVDAGRGASDGLAYVAAFQAPPRGARPPLSFAQQRLWFLQQLDPTSVTFQMGSAQRHRGLDAEHLRRAFELLVHRHEHLRTTFPAIEGEPYQHVHPPAPWHLELADLRALDADAQLTALAHMIAEQRAPFDLATGPLLRTRLVQVGPDEHVLLVTLHHILTDVGSQSVFWRDLWAFYDARTDGRDADLPPLSVQYADYAAWQRSVLAGHHRDRELAYWTGRLRGAPEETALPLKGPRPPVQTNDARLVSLTLAPPLTKQLRTLSHRVSASLFMTLTASLRALLVRYTNQPDILLGTLITDRSVDELEGLIGMFANTLVLRNELRADDTFSTLHAREKENALAAYEHQHVPFELIVDALGVQRSLDRHPVFQVQFVHHADGTVGLRGEAIAVDTQHNVHLDLGIQSWEHDDRISLSFRYNVDLFDAATIEQLVRHYQRILEHVAHDADRRLDRLDLLEPDERQQILHGWNATAHDYSREPFIPGLIEAQVDRTPDAIAVTFEGSSLTYRELDDRANRLAHYLIAAGARRDQPIGVCLDRSIEMVVTLIAVIKAGAAYMPIDPAAPDLRVRSMLHDSTCKLVVGRAARAPFDNITGVWLDEVSDVIATCSARRPEIEITGETAAYVLFTSGSTGNPKGAVIEHAGFRSRLLWANALGFSAADCMLQKTPFTFDVSVFELFYPFIVGARLVIARPDGHRDPWYLATLINDERVSYVHFVPSMFGPFLAAAKATPCPSLRRVICSGEALTLPLVREAASVLDVELYNLYGPTEATIDVSWWRCDIDMQRSTVPIGVPVHNTRLYILDREYQPVPIGVSGELFIAGVQLARGYIGRSDLTAERFVPDPFHPGERMYRTGDLARFGRDGAIEYLGRIDHQIKLRGFRIELGEVEAALQASGLLEDAAVLLREDITANPQLVAYIVPRSIPGGPALDIEDLKRALRASVPDYMVPTAFVSLAAFPLTSSGKLDRKALPAPDLEDSSVEYVAPRTAIETTIAEIWKEILGAERVGAKDNFFALGGHSLLVMRLVSRIRSAFAIQLPVRAVFEAPVVEDLATLIARHGADDASFAPVPPLVAISRAERLPLSFPQQRLWFLHQLEPDSHTYQLVYTRRITGLDIEHLRGAFEVLVQRHEILRTTFPMQDGEPYQRVHAPAPWVLGVDDVRSLSPDAQAAALVRTGMALRRPFDLAAGPLLRTRVVRVGDDAHVVFVTMHHIITDGGSYALLWRELWACYDALVAGRPVVLPPLSIQYADYAAWQRCWLHGAELERQLAFWTERLRGAPEETNLPFKGPRPPHQTFGGRAIEVTLDPDLTRRLRALARREGASLFITFAASLRALIVRYSGQSDVLLGTAIANRNTQEIEGLIGMFVNTLVLRNELYIDDTFVSLLAREKRFAISAYDHQHTPFELVVDALNLERSLSRPPVFQVMYIHQGDIAADLRGTSVDTNRKPDALVDLLLQTWERGEELSLSLVYNEDLFDHALMEQLVRHYVRLLELTTRDPLLTLASLELLDDEDRRRLHAWSNTARQVPEPQTLHALVAAQAARTPQAIAVVFEDIQLTYRELADRVERVAAWLCARGVTRGHHVTIAVERSADMVVATLAVLRSGAAYVPIDPEYPAHRRDFMRQDAGAIVELTDATLRDALQSAYVAPIVHVDGEDVAYILYTSGSTGLPKGVRVPHRAVVNFLRSMQREPGIAAHDTLLAVTTLSFDIAGLELYLPLITGAKVVIADRDTVRDASLLARLVDESAATVMQATPATWRMLLTAGWLPPAHLTILCGGEALPPDLAATLLTSAGALWNLYGPTETTIWSTVARVERDRPISIGRPIDNTTIYILDQHHRRTPIGVAGELYIGGCGVALGYHQRPELTAERFVDDPFAPLGQRMYRTGDLARWTPNGTLEHLGRLDSQVKLRGFRIELGEIEAALRAQPNVTDAAALVREDAPGDPRLVAYVVGGPAAEALQAGLAATLPAYMIPGAIVVLDALPLTPNGKLDRRALPAPELTSRETYVVPRTEQEAALARVWAELLGVERVGVRDDFFALGGHSLLAIRLLARVERSLGVKIPLRELFVDSTLGGLAARVGQARASDSAVERPTLYSSATRRARLPAALRGVFKLNKLMTSDLFGRHVWSAWIDGPLDLRSLERAVAAMRVRHALLRTRFFEDDKREMLEVLDPADVERFALLERADLSSLSEAEQPGADADFHRSASFRPLDVGHGEVMSVALSRWSETRHRLTVSLHNIVSDGESVTVYVNELCDLWRAFAANPERDPIGILPPAPLQYHHLADYLERVHDSEVGRAHRVFWKARLEGIQPLELPTDSPREEVDARREANAGVVAFRSSSVSREIPPEVLTAIERIAESKHATVMSTLVAAMTGYLSQCTSQRDLAFITRLSHRYLPGLERALGFLVNPIVLRISTAGAPSFSELVERTHGVVADAFDHGECDLFELAPYSAFRFCLVYLPVAQGGDSPLPLPSGTSATRAPHPSDSAEIQIAYDLVLWLKHHHDRVQLQLVYNLELFRDKTAAALLEGYVKYITAVCQEPPSPRGEASAAR